MKFGSLFSGIGGIDLGLERAGMVCKWQVEIDEFCLKVLNKHWPDIERFEDVRKVGKHNLETVDLIVGGFPCQPHSYAGKRKGAADDRNLWPEFSRIIADLRPKYVLAENVPGIITSYLDTVLTDLESQAYTIATINLPALAFDAPHRRERIFVVAYSKSARQLREEQQENSSEGAHRGSTDDAIEVSEVVTYTNQSRLEGSERRTKDRLFQANNISSPFTAFGENWDELPKSTIRRGDDGFSSRVDRLRALGNAVVPQVAEWIGRRILEFDSDNAAERERIT